MLLAQYQKPHEVDKITVVQAEVDEVKDIALRNLDALLARGESIDTLVAETEELSITTKTFARTAKDQNACCVLL